MEKKGLAKLLEFVRMQNAFRLVERVTYANGTDRMENDTEHSYNLAMLAWYVADSEKLDLDRNLVVKYALIHDLVEVYAGDTPVYSDDVAHVASKKDRERDARERLAKEFPSFTGLHELMEQYEQREDRESRFVCALDKLQPVLQTYLDGGRIWKEKGVTIKMIYERKKDKIALSPEIQPYFDEMIVFLKENENRLFKEAKK